MYSLNWYFYDRLVGDYASLLQDWFLRSFQRDWIYLNANISMEVMEEAFYIPCILEDYYQVFITDFK